MAAMTIAALDELPLRDLQRALGALGVCDFEQSSKAPREGDYAVYRLRQTFTSVQLVRREGRLALEEAGISTAAFARQRISWTQWRERGYPKALYHFLIQWPPDKSGAPSPARLLRITGKNKRAYLPLLLQALWHLPLDSLAGEPLPAILSANPPVCSNADRASAVHAYAGFRGRWPKDGSYISDSPFSVYFLDSDEATSRGLTYWPILMQLGAKPERELLRLVEWGTADGEAIDSSPS